ncbi:MAG: acetyl-CoA carboxylase biotin carboxyl carrier protein subunit [Rhodospirillales bacterium]|nr:acetyl-CoA carboxylase biotin carboxyl carrier protein subunit [Rhodospirillales bacterium]MDE0711575.1 acetyl-CoA carboxylase biotin carboxyl carrier protein subunit [Rhodospirillales bacterium]
MPNFPVDEPFLRRLAELMNETDLAELELTFGRRSIRLARGALPPAPVNRPPDPDPVPAEPAAPEPAPSAPDPDRPEEFANHLGAVTSPMVGTLYVAAAQGAEPFIKVGDEVGEGDQLFIIEAMKTMNAVLAHRGGTVAQIFVEDATPVEFGALLAIIE